MFSSIFLCIERVFSGKWATETWKYNCMSLECSYSCARLHPTAASHAEQVTFLLCISSLWAREKCLVLFTALSIISSSVIPVRLYCHLFCPTGWIALLSESWLKTCDPVWQDWPAYFFFTGQSCCFNLGNCRRRTERGADWEQELILRSWTCFLFQLLWQLL